MNKSNKIIETMPIGYYIVGVTADNIYYETPILASVKYFNNKNYNNEVISTNYITLNNYGYVNSCRTVSNFNYIKHPDNLIYKIHNIKDGIGNGISVDEFKNKFIKKNIIADKYDLINNNVEDSALYEDEVYDVVHDEITEAYDSISDIKISLEKNMDTDDYSSDFESDISSSDRELLDYYY